MKERIRLTWTVYGKIMDVMEVNIPLYLKLKFYKVTLKWKSTQVDTNRVTTDEI